VKQKLPRMRNAGVLEFQTGCPARARFGPALCGPMAFFVSGRHGGPTGPLGWCRAIGLSWPIPCPALQTRGGDRLLGFPA
jgi:hypothetical protein